MVLAKREGRKTMTRRMVPEKIVNAYYDYDDWASTVGMPSGVPVERYWEKSYFIEKCKYSVGDILWTRESFQYDWKYITQEKDTFYFYKADWINKGVLASGEKWKPSIHMPYIACRMWDLIKSVKVERVQDISTEDILKEGVRYGGSPKEDNMCSPVFKIGIENSALSFMPESWEKLPEEKLHAALLFAHWAELWCEINGRESWDDNPWVYAVEFEPTEKPEQKLN